MKSGGIIFFALLIIAHSINCAKILGVFPAPARSHYILGSSLMRELAEKGHDVTVISGFSEKSPPKNGSYREIVLKEVVAKMAEARDKEDMFSRAGANPFLMTIFMGYMMPPILEGALANEDVQKLIHSDEKFDVVITEQFMNDAQKALSTHFGASLVLLSTMGANNWVNTLVGNPAPPSYIRHLVLDYSVPMSFWQRLLNSVLVVFHELYYHYYVYPKQNEMIKKYIPNGPNLNDVLYNASVVLMNSHPSINQPVPYVPNMIDIGGFHVKPPKKLPEDLQKFLDDAKDGVIYFSMGSNLKSAQLPVEKRDAILKTFSKLRQKILWKWEDDVLPGQPPNVKLSKWLPQQDVLAHPNVKLFITHGGYLSTTEAIYHGVPILAIPVFGDQKLNAKNAENSGYGRMLSYQEVSEEKLTKNIEEILNNPKYANNVKKRSQLFHDRLVTPMDTAVYWIEYVIRHKGAPHLRVAGLDLPWYKYHLLDVIGFVVVVILISVFILYRLVKSVSKKYCSKPRGTKLKTN